MIWDFWERIRQVVSEPMSLKGKALAHKLAELESKLETHDETIRSLVSAIRQLMAAPERPTKKIGFHLREKHAAYGRR